MRGNNYGLKTRDMAKAARFAMNREAANKDASFSTAATIADRFNQFAQFAKFEGLRRLEEVTREHVASYGQDLAERVANGELSPAYAQNLVSAVNTVMDAATRGQWQSVSPTRECGITHRSSVRDTPAVATDRGKVEAAQAAMTERGQAITGLALDLGLRSKEASLINATGALKEAQETGRVTIIDGTKGGRLREIPITHERQIESLSLAARVQGEARSLVPEHQSWATFRGGELREIRETLQAHQVPGLHDLRAAYASERYQALTGERPPIEGGQASRAADLAARHVLAVELGHGRIDIINAYIGGRP